MARYHHKPMAELTHQLKLSPVRLRLRQLEAAEYLVDLIVLEKNYPYDFVCDHITGYRPKKVVPQRAMSGKSLVEDLVQLIEDLSAENTLPAGALQTICWTTEQLAKRLKVSTKTICRWRRRGLPGRKLRYADGTVRMSFLEINVRRFVAKNYELVQRGAAFKQLSEAEKEQIIKLARAVLVERRMRLHELAQNIAAKVDRAVETIRYTIRQYDKAHPEEALFSQDDQPAIRPELQAIYDKAQSGLSLAEVGKVFGHTVEAVKAIVREVRARTLLAAEISYIYNQEFESPSADETILNSNSGFEKVAPKRIRPPKDLPPYLQDLYRQPLLSPRQERDLFRHYNYLKFKTDRLRSNIDPFEVSDETLDQTESLLAKIEQLKNQILQANLRLVVSIARRHVGMSSCFFEVVSDGNLSLMRAVEKFDYARGYKFSTYASWAIMRNYARTIPEEMYHSAKFVTGSEEMLACAPDETDTSRDSILEAARHMVRKGLGLLNARERKVVVWHYGLDNEGKTTMTLEQIGKIFGVSKERIRQIERKAFGKIRAEFGNPGEDLA